MPLSIAERIHHVRHDLERAADMLPLRVEAGARGLIGQAVADLDVIAADLTPGREARAEARERAAAALAAALQREGRLAWWRRVPFRQAAGSASPSIAAALLARLDELPAEVRRALWA